MPKLEITCPVCSKFIDKVNVTGVAILVRKHKFCGNYIRTYVENNKIVTNEVDAKENSFRILHNVAHKSNKKP